MVMEESSTQPWTSNCHMMEWQETGFGLMMDLLHPFTAHDYTLQVTVTQRLVFSAMFLSSGFQWQTFGSSASRLTSLQGGDHLMPASYSDQWLQLLTPKLDSIPIANLQLQLSILNWFKLFQDPLMCSRHGQRKKHRFQQIPIVAYACCLMMALVFLRVYETVA
jgi:hypothetical protein